MASFLNYPGQISSKAAAKRPGILGATKVNRPNEEPFHGKQGLGDQGGADWNKPLDGGDTSVAGTGHINTKQRKGAPGIKPVKGAGAAGREHQPVRRNQIDNRDTQGSEKRAGVKRNTFVPTPTPGGGKKSPGKVSAKGPPAPRAAGKKSNPSNPNQYGDPNSRKFG